MLNEIKGLRALTITKYNLGELPMYKILVPIIFIIILSCTGCGNNNENNSTNGAGGGGGTGIAYANTIINDSNGEIGKAVQVSSGGITLYSSKNYIYNLIWNGSLFPDSIYYSGTNCTGTAYVSAYYQQYGSQYGKTVYFGAYLNKLYIAKTINLDGSAYFDTANKVTFNSHDSIGVVSNVTSSSYLIELVETDRLTTGIPASITPPLSIEFK